MSWRIGYWCSYGEGEIHQVLKKCINTLLQNKFEVLADFATEKKELTHSKALFEALKDYEKKHGVNDLLSILTSRIVLGCTKKNAQIRIDIFLRVPTKDKEAEDIFKDMIIEWVENNSLTFAERFFRLPKITEDISDRYLDNPLEKALKKSFGYDFQYKVLIRCEKSFAGHEEIREKLYEILH